MSEFFNMDGYGFFIWPSYICTFIIMLGFFISSGKQQQTAIAKVKRHIHRMEQV